MTLLILLEILISFSYAHGSVFQRTCSENRNIKSHYENLELARKALDNTPMLARDFSWLTLPADSRLLPEAKRMIRQFEDQLSEFLEAAGAEPDEVYRLSVQLFPLTESENLQPIPEGDVS